MLIPARWPSPAGLGGGSHLVALPVQAQMLNRVESTPVSNGSGQNLALVPPLSWFKME